MKTKILFLFITLTFLVNCGYSPVLIEKDYSFSIRNIEKIGNKQINKVITNKLSPLISKDDIKKKEYELILTSNLVKNITSKDSKGDPSIYEMEIIVEIQIKDSSRNIDAKRKINKKVSYNNKDDKFELSTYENTLIQNISQNIGDRILSTLSNL